MPQQTPKPTDNAFIVKVQPADSPKHQLGDIIVGSFGLTGALVLAAVISGALLAGLWIVWRKSRRTYDTDAPPSLGSVPLASGTKTELDQRSDR
jgi:hypothetical protein